jgi:hypothetical protein
VADSDEQRSGKGKAVVSGPICSFIISIEGFIDYTGEFAVSGLRREIGQVGKYSDREKRNEELNKKGLGYV